jgi:Flp pilus assembly pilin Flp
MRGARLALCTSRVRWVDGCFNTTEDDMQIALSVIRRFRRVEEGQDLLEYALLCSLIALVAFGAVTTVGNTILTVFWNVIAAANI